MLTAEQIQHFHEHGFVVAQGALMEGDLAPVRDGFSAWIDEEAQHLHTLGRLPQTFADEPFERRLARICEHDFSIYEHVDLMDCRLEAVFDFLQNDRLLDLIEPIVGPEILCSPIQHSRAKLPEDLKQRFPAGTAEEHERWSRHVAENVAPWHQDAQVHLEDADPVPILTVWVPLVDATPENGCIQLIRDVPATGLVYWGSGFGIDEDGLPEGEVITLPMAAGDVLLMHKLTPHQSTPNRTQDIRWSLDLRYQPVGTPTGRGFYPDFTVRSRHDPSAVSEDYATWCGRWEKALAETPAQTRPRRSPRPTTTTPMQVDA
ncbi:MAG: mitomycin antibiotic biosynthesis protein [Gemmatimonadetes bacterium]|jgi:phytanoyl-CoA hydroxylase|nr:mitomycin antibiotic biosynthesis protein [Gemmatimonadota bacterium]MBT7863972.1 mitomycin antibiotic biosynthesis protein [Gemmatimonadota bacterium]